MFTSEMNTAVLMNISQLVIKITFPYPWKSSGSGREITLATVHFYVKGEYSSINLQLFVKPKRLLTRICLHGYQIQVYKGKQLTGILHLNHSILNV